MVVAVAVRARWQRPLFIDASSTVFAVEGRGCKASLFKEVEPRLKSCSGLLGERSATLRAHGWHEVRDPHLSAFFASAHSHQVVLCIIRIDIGRTHGVLFLSVVWTDAAIVWPVAV